MSSKARSLRERMSIDPDAPSPVTERRPRPRPVEPAASVEPAVPAVPADPAETSPSSPPTEQAPPREDPAAEPQVAPVAPPAAAPEPEVVAEPAPPVETPSAPSPTPTKRAPSRSRPTRSASRRTRRSGKDGLDWETALDDPAISEGGNGYRSFYVSDEVFARFRAAVYWTARRPDVDDVPDNMSVGIEDYMDSVASDLERRFNGKAVFPPTPDQVRAHRKRQPPT